MTKSNNERYEGTALNVGDFIRHLDGVWEVVDKWRDPPSDEPYYTIQLVETLDGVYLEYGPRREGKLLQLARHFRGGNGR